MKYFIGIDIGGTTIKGGVVSEDNHIISKKIIDTKAFCGYEVICDDICDMINELTTEANVKIEDISRIGMGSPGAIDVTNGVVLTAANLGFKNAPIAEYIKNKTGVDVFLGNDANCAALGEFVLTETTAKSMAMITIGTGFGFGLIVNGQPYVGETYGGGEYGHTSLIFEGKPCTCGQNGCVEAYASFTAFMNQIDDYIKENPDSELASMENLDGKKMFELAKSDFEPAKKLVDRFITYISQAVVNIVNTFDTKIIVIGGGISKSSEYFLPKVYSYVEKNRFCKEVAMPEICVASKGNDIAIIGAANLC